MNLIKPTKHRRPRCSWSAWICLLGVFMEVFVVNIDMFWIWLIVISSTFIFQNHFTEKVTTWDVVYTYTDDSTDFLTFGQMSLTSHSSSLPWRAARTYIKEDMEKKGKLEVIVTIIAVHKETDKRVFKPFWKHLSWYS